MTIALLVYMNTVVRKLDRVDTEQKGEGEPEKKHLLRQVLF
jgi:hypothetical protein